MSDSLAPGLLIATPPLGDPNFDRTVVLLAIHNEEGALGFVVNREAPLSLGELLEHAGYDEVGEHAGPVWIGGPVQPGSGWVLVDDPAFQADGEIIEVGERLRISSSREAFDSLAQEVNRPSSFSPPRMVILGYSGWGEQQLEEEIARGAWLPVPLDERILFEVEPSKRWEEAYALLGLSLTHVMSMNRVGEA